MKTFYTKKLFCNKFPYKILISRKTNKDDPNFHNGWTVAGCKNWLLQNNIEYKIYTRISFAPIRVNSVKYKSIKQTKKKDSQYINFVASIFLQNKSDLDKFLINWEPDIISITIPYDNNHIDILKNDSSIVIRKTLLYKKFKYSILFKSPWKYGVKDKDTEVEDWIQSNIVDTKDNTEYKWWNSGSRPRLYLIDESDLLLVKLSLGDSIREIVVVHTFDELMDQTTGP